MKNLTKSLIVLALVVIALGSATAVFAQGNAPEGSGLPYGRGGREDRGNRGAMLDQNRLQLEDELLHDEFVAAFAVALDLTEDEINASLENDETLMQIVLSTGLDFEAARELIKEVRTQVIEQAAVDGIITQEQADWMLSRIAGAGRMGGKRGNGQGLYGSGQGTYGAGDCIND